MNPLTDILLGIGSKVIDRIFPDPAQAAAAQLELFKLQTSGELAQMTSQIEVNKEEAKSPSILIAGWRPFIGWICGFAFAMNFVLGPLIMYIGAIFGHPLSLPSLNMAEMSPVLMGMLGLGAYRTYEKVKSAEGNR